jgi:hypothetical protein
MKEFDVSSMIVVYNLVIGVLIMLSSEKLGSLAGSLNRANSGTLVRLTRVSTFTFGAAVTVLSATIYIAFHLLKIGV